MDQGLKERLVGAAVLIAIAVWLIPWVLDGPETPLESGGSSLQLPAAEEPMPMRTQTLRLGAEPDAAPATAVAPPPAVEPDPVAAAEPPPADDTAVLAANPSSEAPVVAAVRPEPEPERAAPAAAAPAPAATPPKPAPSAASGGDWTVQLGSFGEEANARRVAQRAGTFGHKAEVSPIRSNGRTLYRVRVTPARSRAEADAAASALKAHGIADARVVSAR
jgi:DedD protein